MVLLAICVSAKLEKRGNSKGYVGNLHTSNKKKRAYVHLFPISGPLNRFGTAVLKKEAGTNNQCVVGKKLIWWEWVGLGGNLLT